MGDSNGVERARTVPRASSEILDRLPPQNLDAEKGVLGSLLLDPQLCDDVALLLRPDDFYADANQRLYRPSAGACTTKAGGSTPRCCSSG